MSRRRQSTRGMALIVVLGIVVLFAFLATMCLTASRTSQVTGRVNVLRQQAKHLAESTQAEILWLVVSARAARPAVGGTGLAGLAAEPSPETSIWMANGETFTLALDATTTLQYRILDANRGYSVEDLTPGTLLRRKLGLSAPSEDEEASQLDYLFDALDDYVDRDDGDSRRLHGKEAPDYAAEGFPGLPRNARLQFAEEAYWLPNVELLSPALGAGVGGLAVPEDLLRVIPPPNAARRRPASGGHGLGGGKASVWPSKPSFFSSSPGMIQVTVGLTPEELERVIAARQAWFEEGKPIREGLGDLYGRISREMDLTMSSILTFEVRVAYLNGQVSRRTTATLDIHRLPVGGVRPYFSIWRRLVY